MYLNGFYELDNEKPRTEFFQPLMNHIGEKKDGEYIYAFINDTENNYVKLKIVKDEDEKFLGFVRRVEKDGEIRGIIVDTDVFKSSSNNVLTGYALDEATAIMTKLVMMKEAIDGFCKKMGHGDLDCFSKEFNKFKDKYPEKLIWNNK